MLFSHVLGTNGLRYDPRATLSGCSYREGSETWTTGHCYFAQQWDLWLPSHLSSWHKLCDWMNVGDIILSFVINCIETFDITLPWNEHKCSSIMHILISCQSRINKSVVLKAFFYSIVGLLPSFLSWCPCKQSPSSLLNGWPLLVTC